MSLLLEDVWNLLSLEVFSWNEGKEGKFAPFGPNCCNVLCKLHNKFQLKLSEQASCPYSDDLLFLWAFVLGLWVKEDSCCLYRLCLNLRSSESKKAYAEPLTAECGIYICSHPQEAAHACTHFARERPENPHSIRRTQRDLPSIPLPGILSQILWKIVLSE